jgi:hypothetical protein
MKSISNCRIAWINGPIERVFRRFEGRVVKGQ